MPPSPGVGRDSVGPVVGLLAVKAQKADDPLPAGRLRPPGVMQETHDPVDLFPQGPLGIGRNPGAADLSRLGSGRNGVHKRIHCLTGICVQAKNFGHNNMATNRPVSCR